MTEPKYAANVPGKGRWYTHPTTGETWPSVTNVLDFSVSKPNLVPWAAKLTATKAWDELPRMVALSRKTDTGCEKKRVADRCGNCRFCLNAEIKSYHREIKEIAADLGDRVHWQAQSRVLGRPVEADPGAKPFVAQLLRFWLDFGVDPTEDYEMVESTVVNRRVGYAGTLDAIIHLTIGGKRVRVLMDYKTSRCAPGTPNCTCGQGPKTPCTQVRKATEVYPENGLQVAALAKAETVLLDDGTELPMPKVDRLAVLSLRPDSYALMPMPFTGTVNDAFTAFVGALHNATYLHSTYGVKPLPIEPKNEKGEAA